MLDQTTLDHIGELDATASKGPWTSYSDGSMVFAKNPYGKGLMHVADIRGWGHLTGKGHGAVGLPENEAIEIQKANGQLISEARTLIPELRDEVIRLQKQVKKLKAIAESSHPGCKILTEGKATLYTFVDGEYKPVIDFTIGG